MAKILKVFADRAEYPSLKAAYKVIETYDAFIVLEAGDAAAKTLAAKYPVEDLTSEYELQFGERPVDTSQPRITEAGDVKPHPAYKGVKKPGPGPHHYVVQFIGPIKPGWVNKVRSAGGQPRTPYGSFAWIVRATDAALKKIAALPFVRWVGHLPYHDRISPEASGESEAGLPRRQVRPGVYTLEVFAPEDLGRVARDARKIGFTVLSQEPKAKLLIVKSTSSEKTRIRQVNELSAVHGVRYIRERTVPRPSNNVATGIMGNAWASLSAGGPKLTGKGEVIAVCDTGLDTGDPAQIHPDFAGRVAAIKSYPITSDWNNVITNPGADDGPADLDSGHGTHVTGSVLGNGSASAAGPVVIRGHAYEAKLVFQAIEQEMKWKPDAPPEYQKERYLLAGIPNTLAPLFQFAYNQSARVHSNSWGGGDPGAYDDQCRQFDEFVWSHKDFCFVIAAGNDGSDSDGDGKINLQSVTSPGTAKNVITVGACENKRPEFDQETYGKWWKTDFPKNPPFSDPMANNPDQVVAFSSRGPTTDGRIKPDVLAPGTFILSTRSTRIAANNFAWAAYPPNKLYFHMGGTSMATPLTSGAVALLREYLRTTRGIAQPSAALLKALLIAGARTLPGLPAGSVMDNNQGYGRVNLDGSVKKPLLTIDGKPLATGQKASQTLKVPSTTGTLRIVLAYSDFAGPKLVNNLNLLVTDPAGKRRTGNGPLTPGGILQFDNTNNVELVSVQKPAKGTWTIDVVASNVSSGPQDYALAAVIV
jgi:hypothetical protein